MELQLVQPIFTANDADDQTFTVTVPGTNISVGTVTSANVPINSSTGTGISTLPAATGTLAGILTAGTQSIGGVKTFPLEFLFNGGTTGTSAPFTVRFNICG